MNLPLNRLDFFEFGLRQTQSMRTKLRNGSADSRNFPSRQHFKSSLSAWALLLQKLHTTCQRRMDVCRAAQRATTRCWACVTNGPSEQRSAVVVESMLAWLLFFMLAIVTLLIHYARTTYVAQQHFPQLGRLVECCGLSSGLKFKCAG